LPSCCSAVMISEILLTAFSVSVTILSLTPFHPGR
jgi:hypothetical protein